MATPPTFSAGAVLTAAQMNAVGLWEIKSEAIGSAVATYSPGTVFSTDYENYMITINGGAGSTSADIRMTLGSTATGYYSSLTYGLYNSTAIANANGANTANWPYAGASNTNTLDLVVVLRNPFLSKVTTITSFYNQAVAAGGSGVMHGFLNNTTSYTTFTITPNIGTWTGGTVRVYGLIK